MKKFLSAILFSAACTLASAQWDAVLSGSAASGGGGSITVIAAAQSSSAGDTTVIVPSTTAGDSIVVGVMSVDTTTGASDNIGTTTGWHHTTERTNTTPQHVVFWYKDNVPSGVTTVTIAGSTVLQIFAVVVRGTNVAGSFTTGEENGGGSSSATTNPQTGSVTNATATSILFALYGSDSGINPITMTPNGTGSVGTWTLDATNSQQVNGTTRYPGNMVYQIVSSSSARAHGWTTTSTGYCVAIAAFHN